MYFPTLRTHPLLYSEPTARTKKNCHIARRYHYVKLGVKTGDHTLEWIGNDDMLADDLTKSQDASKSLPHMERTLVKIPNYVKGYKSEQVGNR